MKPATKISVLPFLVLAAGGVGLMLRVLLYTIQPDAGYLLPRNHPLHILCILLSLFVAAALVVIIRSLRGTNNYRDNFPASRLGGFGAFGAALFLAAVAASLFRSIENPLTFLCAVLCLLSVPSLIITAYSRMTGFRPKFYFHGIFCLFLTVYMICRYRVWSADPQVVNYLFQMFASVCLCITAYYRTAFDAGMGKRRLFLLFSLLSVYLCFLSLVGSGDSRFYFGCGMWAFSGLFPACAPYYRRRSREG